MTHEIARKLGLDPVYPSGHELGNVVFYDFAEGKYYDASVDMYLDDRDSRIPLNTRSSMPLEGVGHGLGH